MNSAELLERINSYLSSGGLFNPEEMEHDKVRQLILDCREYISTHNSGMDDELARLRQKAIDASFEREYLRDQIPRNYEMGQ